MAPRPLPVITTAAVATGPPVDWSITRPVMVPCLAPGACPAAVASAVLARRMAAMNERPLIGLLLPEVGVGELAATRGPDRANMPPAGRIGNTRPRVRPARRPAETAS